jgi:hypothetical protein
MWVFVAYLYSVCAGKEFPKFRSVKQSRSPIPQNLVIFCESWDQIRKYVRIPVRNSYNAVSRTSAKLRLPKMGKKLLRMLYIVQ